MPQLLGLDWTIIAVFFAVVIAIGIWASRSAGKSSAEFFLGGRGMPWWLLGVSMVACTFSADTPNLVAGLVREGGVSKNWVWWAFLITGMVTVFIYAKLWRRSEVMTDLEFYELRYGGKAASFLRGFRAVYLGVFFNILIMATVTLAIIKYGQLIFGASKLECVFYGSIGVLIYATLGGIKGCIWADFFQYSIAMFGAVYAAIVSIGYAGESAAKKLGLAGEKAVEFANNYSVADLFNETHVMEKLSIFPDLSKPSEWIPLLFIPLAVQWWAAWYPGAEPGGGGYIAQRMLSAKDEKNAIGATMFFNFAHYALRPWPWIVVALASLVCFPEIKNISDQFPHVDNSIIAHDIAYPAMISKLGPGFLGLVIASIVAAYMSTIGTHLNWGSSYAVNDFYKRFIKPNASEKDMVLTGRICTVALMIVAGGVACLLTSATQAFDILLLSGAGSGAIYLLRWFWWRVNAWSEIVAMIATTITALVLVLIVPNGSLSINFGSWQLDHASMRFFIAVIVTTIAWMSVTLPYKYVIVAWGIPAITLIFGVETIFLARVLDSMMLALFAKIFVGVFAGLVVAFLYFNKGIPAESKETLRKFFRKCHPGGPGWAKIVKEARADGEMIDAKIHGQTWEMPVQILCVFIGCVAIYCSLFSIGSFIYGEHLRGGILGGIAVVSMFSLFKLFGKLRAE